MNYYVVTGSNARFIGSPPCVQWTGTGDAKVTAAINTQLAAGNLVQVDLTGGPNAFQSTILNGPLPTGDTLHAWTGDEFANTTQLQTPPHAGSAKDQTARDMATAAGQVAASVQMQLDVTKGHLTEAGKIV